MYLGHDFDLSRSRDVIGHVLIFSYRWSVDTSFLTDTVTHIRGDSP